MNKFSTIAAVGLLLLACKKEQKTGPDQLTTQQTIRVPAEAAVNKSSGSEKYNTFYGPVVRMGEGFIRSWINITHDDKPLAIGIEMTEGALQHDHEAGEHESGEHSHGNEHVLPLHQKGKALTPFDHVSVNWSGAGHPPPGIYTVPHLDIHFYKIKVEERRSIPSYAEATAAFENNPPAGYLPGGYKKAPAGEPRMGAHWMDVTSPEFQGQPFTHTFVFGSYDGKVNFYEPMVTITTMQSGTTIRRDIRQPQYFDPVNTYYPTVYSIWKDGNRHYVAMDGMVWR